MQVSKYLSSCLLLLLTLIQFELVGAKNRPDLAILHIDPSLFKNANAIIRNKEGHMKVVDKKQVILNVNTTVTVLNEAGRHAGEIFMPYDRFSTVKDLDACIYDQDGRFVRKTKGQEVKDFASGAAQAGFSDHRVKMLDVVHNIYPYTIEIKYTVKIKGLISYPDWPFLFSEGLSVERNSLTIDTPIDFQIDYHSANIEAEPEITSTKSRRLYNWEVVNLMAVRWEDHQPNTYDVCPVLYLKPLSYKIENREGESASWKDVGLFFYELNRDRHQLDDKVVAEIKLLVSDGLNKKEKVRALYHYLQDQCRYVSIQLGIGGWQCIKAEKVHKVKYGDCKALVNYMKALLAAVDITSFPVLVNAGEQSRSIITDFPDNQFNHVVLCVPLESDSIWLECTSQTAPFDYLGPFSNGRYGLLCSPEGGKLIKTPSLKATDNLTSTFAEIKLNKNGKAQVKGKTIYNGYAFHEPLQNQQSMDKAQRKRWFLNSANVSCNGDIKLDLLQLDRDEPSIEMEFEFESNNIATSSSQRIFLHPKFMDQAKTIRKYDKRTFPFENKHPFTDVDSLIYFLPEGYVIENSNAFPVEVNTGFGHYIADCKLVESENILIYTMKLQVDSFYLKPDRYSVVSDFFKRVSIADNELIVLKKSN